VHTEQSEREAMRIENQAIEESEEEEKMAATRTIPSNTQFDPIRWRLANPWLTEGQPDDRTQVDGTVITTVGSKSARRASARLSHQLMFKRWSQERHD
jgi:hypothetical protein